MASERDDFSLSGPKHLTSIDWTDANHRRSVAASLVKGVYILEKERQLKRERSEALANQWWEFFHFKLLWQLVDDVGSSVFGAIYEFKPPASQLNCSLEGCPRYVIAFRGTVRKRRSLLRDIELNTRIFCNRLHKTSCFETAMQAVRNVTANVGESNVWLAGHSLGAAMAMLAGKTMAKSSIFMEAFLFNSPYISAPVERIKNNCVKKGIRISKSVIKAGLAFAMNANETHSIDPFDALSSWVPNLFVNPADMICSEYIGYFEHRKNMDDFGLGAIERLATQHSLGGLLMNAMGGGSTDSEPLHLIPSARLTINMTPARDFTDDHGIRQWWRPGLNFQSKLYQYK